jgi:diadenosine tetraphosphate (Ap4A) HIT family hydrolase
VGQTSRSASPEREIERYALIPSTFRGKLGAMDCVACELADGRRHLPGGRIFTSSHWLVEHCVGPLGLGCLIVKPKRHVTAVADLRSEESQELGPLLQRASAVARDLVGAEQVYNCLWSHAGGVPVHIHFVVQPVTANQIGSFGCYGPNLQVAMFTSGVAPDADAVEVLADRARGMFSD